MIRELREFYGRNKILRSQRQITLDIIFVYFISQLFFFLAFYQTRLEQIFV